MQLYCISLTPYPFNQLIAMSHHPNFPRILISTVLSTAHLLAAEPVAVELDPIIITGSPLGGTLFEQAQPVSVLEGDKLLLSLEPSLGETLSKTAGVRSTYYGPAASRPVIRGLDGDRIRVLQNGLNTIDASATSVDHAVSFDPVSVQRIEVVRGPATLLYGANAIGGVVNVIDGRIADHRIDESVRGSLGSQYSSVSSGVSKNAMLEGGVGGWTWHLEGYQREGADLRIPGDARSARLQHAKPLAAGEKEESGHLENSYLNTEGFSLGTSYIWDSGYFGLAYSGFDAQYGSPAEKAVSIDLTQRRWDFQGAFNAPISKVKSIKYRFATSDYEHTEFEGGEGGTQFKNRGFDGRIEFAHEKLGPFEGALGFQFERSDFSALGDEKFLPRVLTNTRSAFLFEELTVNDTCKLQGGLRYDHISADAAEDKDFGPARSRTFNNVSGSLGLVVTPTDDYAVALSAAYSRRAATYQELYAFGPHVATGTFEIGDANLPVEQALGLDLSLRKRTGLVTGSATVYYNRFQNFIGQFTNGETRPFGEGELLPVYAYRATDAEFYGGELEATVHLLKPVTAPEPVIASGKNPVAPVENPSMASAKLDLELKADYVHATDISSHAPLPRISPFHASVALDYHHGAYGARLEGIWAAAQSRVAQDELPTDRYFLVNAALTYTVTKGPVTMDIYLKGVNLTDEEAREHTSFLKDVAPLAGRGVVAGVKLTF